MASTRTYLFLACVLVLVLLLSACSNDKASNPTAPATGDLLVSLNVDNVAAKPFGELFRSVNLDAGKQLNDLADVDRIARLMCTDLSTCTPGAIRYWDKVQFGRFALEQPTKNKKQIAELHSRGFSMFWSLMGVPAFLRDSCTGCVVTAGDDTFHLLREIDLPASDSRNPTGQDISCSCTDSDTWWAGEPTTETVAGVSWLDYLDSTVSDLLEVFDGANPKLRIGLWNEPDQIWWQSTQTRFVEMWCTSAEGIRQTLGEGSSVLVGGPDVSSWDHGIRPQDGPLLKEILETCGEDGSFDFLAYHNYSKPERFLLEDSVAEVRSWGLDEDLIIDVGEYAAALGDGAEATTLCDLSAIAGLDGEVPTPTGVDQSAVLCDHRGAAEEVALAATMAAQDHDRLYRFEVWDWGTTDMVDSRMGLLTINNLPKPAATSFWMLSQLQGERIAVINELDGEFPFHLLASREGNEMVIVVASQDQTVSDQFTRGLLSDGLVFAEDVAPHLAGCAAFGSEDSEAYIAALARAGTTAEQLLDDCPSLDPSLAASLEKALAYAAPRVDHVGQTFQLTIEAPGWQGPATHHRVDAYRNTFAESYRRWPGADFADPEFDFAAEEESLWSYMTQPLDQLDVTDGRLTIEVRPNSVTLLRGSVE